MLSMVRRVFFGPLREPAANVDHAAVRDLGWRESLALAPLAVVVVWIGVQPGFFLRRMAPSLNNVSGSAVQTVEMEYTNSPRQRGWAARQQGRPIAQGETKTRVR